MSFFRDKRRPTRARGQGGLVHEFRQIAPQRSGVRVDNPQIHSGQGGFYEVHPKASFRGLMSGGCTVNLTVQSRARRSQGKGQHVFCGCRA